MQNNLLILFTQYTNPHVDWAIFNPRGQTVASAHTAALETLPARKLPIIALIPSTQLLLTQVIIPSRQWQRIVQAVPYALEEQLAEEVENLHFALGKRDPISGTIPVVVITKNLMHAYQHLLNTCQLKPSAWIPEVLAVPKPASGWGFIALADRILVRTGVQSGFATEPASLTVMLNAALREHTPEQFVVFKNTEDSFLLNTLKQFNIPLLEQEHDHGVLGWLAQTLAQEKPLNLLQGDYKPTHPFAKLWRPWRLTAGFLLLWVILIGMEQGLNYQKLIKQNHLLTEEIEQVYRRTFPNARKVVDPRTQMEQQLKSLRSQQTSVQPHFLALLQQLSGPFKELSGLKINQLDYQSGRFTLLLEAENLQLLEQVKKRLGDLGFTVEIQTTTQRDNLLEGQLLVKYN